MTGGVWCELDVVHGMCRIEIDGFDLREGGKMILLGIERGTLVRRGRCVADSDIILDQPFVDGLRRVGHVDSPGEIRLAENIWQCR